MTSYGRSLGSYRKKRDLGATPDPRGGRSGSRKRLRFVVQRHEARALHHDFRRTSRANHRTRSAQVDELRARLSFHLLCVGQVIAVRYSLTLVAASGAWTFDASSMPGLIARIALNIGGLPYVRIASQFICSLFDVNRTRDLVGRRRRIRQAELLQRRFALVQQCDFLVVRQCGRDHYSLRTGRQAGPFQRGRLRSVSLRSSSLLGGVGDPDPSADAPAAGRQPASSPGPVSIRASRAAGGAIA